VLHARRYPWHDRGVYRWWLVLLVGCYRPSEIETCSKRCGSDPGQTCPPGQICDGNGLCRSVDMQGDCPLDGGVTVDAFEQVDAPLDAPRSGQACFGSGDDFFKVCVDDPLNDETITNARTIDTTQCPQYQTQSAPPVVCVRAWRNLTIGATGSLRVVGGRPLAIVVTQTLQIDGTIDVASHVGGTQGANANVSDCDLAAAGNQSASASGGGGGGAGGALAGGGGSGGTGDGGSTGGTATPPIDPLKLRRIRGGCPGGAGGKAQGTSGGVSGDGGGAIYLMSNTEISVGNTGVINASGGGGNRPGDRAGGAGGGSGGFVGFAAPVYMFGPTALVIAVGGAGASGGGPTSVGNTGLEATAAANTATTPGVGGSGSGGFGAFVTGGSGNPGGANAGGGGGGGGGGVIGFMGALPVSGTFAPLPRLL
jgi:hypothetical protein